MTGLNAREELALRRAVGILEGSSFVWRLTDATGASLTQLMKRLPAVVSCQINKAVRKSLYPALDEALYKMNSELPEPPSVLFQMASGVTGGASAFFGLGALALELPVTTTLMLRSIAASQFVMEREG